MTEPRPAPFVDLHRRLDELFEELIYRRWSIAGPAPPAWRPAADLYEDRDAYLAVLDLPGVPPDRVEIRVTDHELIVSGDRPEPAPARPSPGRRERPCGPFRRSIALAEPIDPDGVRVEYRDGCLLIRLPRRPRGERPGPAEGRPGPSPGRSIRFPAP